MASFIAAEWGSGTLRAMLVEEDGGLIDRFDADLRLAALCRAEVDSWIRALCDRWPEAEGGLWLAGMIGAKPGVAYVRQVECRADRRSILDGAADIDLDGVRCRIMPGLRCSSPFGDPDFLRGEEMVALGYALAGGSGLLLAVPGAHGKWIRIADGGVRQFHTAATVDLFRSIGASALGLSGVAGVDDAFLDGVTRGAAGGSSARLLFTARARRLSGMLTDADAASFAFGTLVGADAADALNAHGWLDHVHVVGSPDAAPHFVAALWHLGVDATLGDGARLSAAGFAAARAEREMLT